MIIKSKQETKTQSRPREDKWNWVEESIWTDTMLSALVNGVKGKKWFSLIDKVYKSETLAKAWKKVKANKGSRGVDNMTIEIFQTNAEKYIQELEQQLKLGIYQPQAIKRVLIPKGDGKTRPLGIPSIKDRIVQTSIKMVIEPIFEQEFLPTSYGFRPGKDAKQALKVVDQLIQDGYTWVVDADLQSYFDTIPHEDLMKDIQERISDGKVLDLIKAFLNQEIMEETKTWNPILGASQGSALSPLLANIYLHPLDSLMQKAGYKIVVGREFGVRHFRSDEKRPPSNAYRRLLQRNRLRFVLLNCAWEQIALTTAYDFAPFFNPRRFLIEGGTLFFGKLQAQVYAYWWNIRNLPRTLRLRFEKKQFLDIPR